MKEIFLKNKTRVAVIAALVVILIGCGIAYGVTSSQPDSPAIAQTEESGVSVNVTCEGWDEETSTPIVLAVYEGDIKETLLSTEEDVEVPEPITEISLIAGEDTELEEITEAGTYTLSIMGSPVLEDGTIFEVPEPQVIEYDGETEQMVSFELVVMDEEDITEEDIEAAEAAAAAVGANTSAVEAATSNTRSSAQSAQSSSSSKSSNSGSSSSSSKSSGSSSSSSSSSSSNKSSGSSSSSSGSSSSSSSSSSSHTHSWTYHEAVVSYYYQCNGCGAKFYDESSRTAHIKEGTINRTSCTSYKAVDYVVTKAYYSCSCGSTK